EGGGIGVWSVTGVQRCALPVSGAACQRGAGGGGPRSRGGGLDGAPPAARRHPGRGFHLGVGGTVLYAPARLSRCRGDPCRDGDEIGRASCRERGEGTWGVRF